MVYFDVVSIPRISYKLILPIRGSVTFDARSQSGQSAIQGLSIGRWTADTK
jgi:hypothetical protein